jgi:hypothetical protein
MHARHRSNNILKTKIPVKFWGLGPFNKPGQGAFAGSTVLKPGFVRTHSQMTFADE